MNLEHLSWITNRGSAQTQMLFDLCDQNFDKLLELEAKIKKNRLSYCPGDKDSVVKILQMSLNSNL